jgi:hypothetical protein
LKRERKRVEERERELKRERASEEIDRERESSVELTRFQERDLERRKISRV